MTNEIKLEVGKVYTDLSKSSRWLFFLNKNDRDFWINLDNMSTHSTGHNNIFGAFYLHPDQSHDITIDIKPNKREPQPGEVWELRNGGSALILGLSDKGRFPYIVLCLEDYVCTYYDAFMLIELSPDQSHNIQLAKEKKND